MVTMQDFIPLFLSLTFFSSFFSFCKNSFFFQCKINFSKLTNNNYWLIMIISTYKLYQKYKCIWCLFKHLGGDIKANKILSYEIPLFYF